MFEKSFVNEVFNDQFAHLLGKREGTFRQIFLYLESLKKDFYTIVETGCCRIQGNYSGDGMSTVLFDAFVNFYDGQVYSFDITESHVALAKALVSEKTKVICQDAVKALFDLSKDEAFPLIDFLYLDSFDIDFSKPHPSALHHVKEFIAIQPKLTKGTLVVIDDHANGIGKGMYIEEYMRNIENPYLFCQYQIGWVIGGEDNV